MKTSFAFSIRLATASFSLLAAFQSCAGYTDDLDIPAPTDATEIAYSAKYQRLVIKNASSAVFVIDIKKQASTPHYAQVNFTDMSMAPDSRHVFMADYGGENIGYGTPSGQSYVHRLDPRTGRGAIEKAYIAGDIQAASATKFVLKSIDQWVTFTYDQWSHGAEATQLNSADGSFSTYNAAVYFGNFRYDPGTGRLIHGNSNSSSQEIQAFKIVNNEFVKQEGTGAYGAAQGYGGTVALATDASTFYYGKLAVDALDVTHTLRIYPELIYAATGDIAFGNGTYYSTGTGAELGTLGFSTTVYGLNSAGTDFWAYDAVTNLLRHFVESP